MIGATSYTGCGSLSLQLVIRPGPLLKALFLPRLWKQLLQVDCYGVEFKCNNEFLVLFLVQKISQVEVGDTLKEGYFQLQPNICALPEKS